MKDMEVIYDKMKDFKTNKCMYKDKKNFINNDSFIRKTNE